MKFTIAIITAFLGMAAASPMEQHHGGNKKGDAADAVASAMGAVPTLPGKALPMADKDVAMDMMDARAPPPTAMGSSMEPEKPKGHKGHKGMDKEYRKRGDKKKGGAMDAAGDAIDDLTGDAKGAAKGAEGIAKDAGKGAEGIAKGAAMHIMNARAPPPTAMGSSMEPEKPKGHKGHKGMDKEYRKRGDKKGVMGAADDASDAVGDLTDDAKGAAKGAEGIAKGAGKGVEGTAKGAAKGVEDAVGNL